MYKQAKRSQYSHLHGNWVNCIQQISELVGFIYHQSSKKLICSLPLV